MLNNDVCPLCSEMAEFKFLEAYFDSSANREYKLYECGSCKAWFWSPLKNPGADWYEHDARYSSRNADPNLKPIRNYKKIISFLKPSTGSVLDIGCGTGDFLFYAKKNGWEVVGIDFDANAIKTAKEIYKLDNVFNEELEEYYKKNKEKKFDLITFFDVFEHLDNHLEFIANVKRMLKPEGYIALSLPYRKRAKWLMPADVPPRHLTRWDRTSIRKFLERNGFKIAYIARQSEGLNPILMKLRFRYGRLFSFNLVGKYKNKKKAEGNQLSSGSQTEKVATRLRILARIKDWLIFGLPALIIWLIMLPSAKRYLNLYVIARLEKQ